MSKIPVYRHKDGTPYVRPYLGTNAVTKKAIRPYKQFPKGLTDEEVQPLAQEWLSGFTPAAKYHVTDRLSDVLYRYVDILEANKKSPNTIKTYRSNVRCYIDPHIPNIRAGELKPYQVDALYNVLLMQGGRKGEGISPSKVINLHWMFAGAYKWFVTQGISEYNPIVSATPPEAPLYEAVAYNEQEFQMLSRALSEALREPADSPEAIFRKNAMFAAYLALNTGERCGELCANSKEDAQLARMMMHIGYTAVEEKEKGVYRKPKPKGKKTRNITLHESVCENIGGFYEWQRSYLAPAKAESWKRMICTDYKGGMLRPSKVSEAFKDMRDRVGLPKNTSFHTLRHTHATWLLLEGMNLKDIADRLGHAKESTTLEIYAHLMPGRDRMAADVFARAAAKMGGEI